MTANVFMAGIVVLDCGQIRQSLAHFLDQQEKHHGAQRQADIRLAGWHGAMSANGRRPFPGLQNLESAPARTIWAAASQMKRYRGD
jgi:hypothetical protein